MAQTIEAVTFGFHGVLANHQRGDSTGRIPTQIRGTRELLKWASLKFGDNLAIVSTASEVPEVRQFLGQYSLREAFRVIENTKHQEDESTKRKPVVDQHSYWRAASLLLNETAVRMEEIAGRVAAIESTVQGVSSAKEAGMMVIGIHGGDRDFAKELGARADMVVKSLFEVPGVLTPSLRFPVAAGGIQ